MPTLTSNYSFNLPLVNNAIDADLWGGQLNANWTSVDSIIAGITGIPIGCPVPYFGSSAPSDFLLCYGQTIGDTGSGADIEGSAYETLFDIVKACSPNNGTESFAGLDSVSIPDLRGRVIAGQDDMGGTSANRLTNQSGGVDGDVLGDTGGSETHSLTSAEGPSHTHSLSLPIYTASPGTTNALGGGSLSSLVGTYSGNTGSSGSGTAHNNVQPTIILNYIVRYQ